MSYAPDPGGNFASDAHRRVMAHLPNPDDDAITFDELVLERINTDRQTLRHFADPGQVAEVLEDLEDDGYAVLKKGCWKNTPAGFEVLTGPPGESDDTAEAPALLALDPAQANSDAGVN